MSQWTGKLFVYKDNKGREFVSATKPTTNGIPKDKIRAYQVTGPYMPVSYPAPVHVPDAAKWIDDLRAKGFNCDPCSIDA